MLKNGSEMNSVPNAHYQNIRLIFDDCISLLSYAIEVSALIVSTRPILSAPMIALQWTMYELQNINSLKNNLFMSMKSNSNSQNDKLNRIIRITLQNKI